MQARKGLAVEVAVARDVDVLATDHAHRSFGQDARDIRSGIRERKAEGLGEQRVAGEDGHALAEANVRACLAAPKVVVVERGKVVVHEAERVHELERARGRQKLGRIATERLAGREAKDGTDALPAAEQRVAERLLELAELVANGSPPRRPRRDLRRSSSARMAFLAPRALDLGLNLLRQVGELAQNVDRLIRLLRLFERLRASSRRSSSSCSRVTGSSLAHRAASLATRPRMPFTSRPASGEANRFASVTASSIATSAGTSPRSSS